MAVSGLPARKVASLAPSSTTLNTPSVRLWTLIILILESTSISSDWPRL
jgi:hypothetical protein